MVVFPSEHNWNFQYVGTVIACCLYWNVIFLPVNPRLSPEEFLRQMLTLWEWVWPIIFIWFVTPVTVFPKLKFTKALLNMLPKLSQTLHPWLSNLPLHPLLKSLKILDFLPWITMRIKTTVYIFIYIRTAPWTVFILDSL